MCKDKKAELFKFAKSIGIKHTGVCSADFDENLFDILKKRRENNSECSFTHKDLRLRSDPSLVLENAKSVIVCLFPYYNEDFEYVNISRYASVTDYHKVIIPKLEKIGSFINDNIEKCQYLCFSDTGALTDRYLAYKAGLGFFGKNNCLINDDFGSFFFIGYVVTTCFFEYDLPLYKSCLGCGECIKNCPGGALGDGFSFNPDRCISYITQIKECSQEQENILKNQKSVYGCDVCQNVCPHNSGLKQNCMEEFQTDKINYLEYDALKEMSNKQFKREYKNFAFSWRGKDVILKNFVGGTYVKQRKDNG